MLVLLVSSNGAHGLRRRVCAGGYPHLALRRSVCRGEGVDGSLYGLLGIRPSETVFAVVTVRLDVHYAVGIECLVFADADGDDGLSGCVVGGTVVVVEVTVAIFGDLVLRGVTHGAQTGLLQHVPRPRGDGDGLQHEGTVVAARL